MHCQHSLSAAESVLSHEVKQVIMIIVLITAGKSKVGYKIKPQGKPESWNFQVESAEVTFASPVL
jgi:hypothetical protein